jgi:5S rRNA maturation endonuclease (ribonuclease M5)/nucleoside-triphosphatase THEP1
VFWKTQLAKHVGLNGNETGWNQILCPLHDDNNPSASISWEAGRFNCFAGCGPRDLRELHNEIFEEGDTDTMPDAPAEDLLAQIREHRNLLPPSEFYATAQAYLQAFVTARGISVETYKNVGARMDLDPGSKTFGYIVFPFEDTHYVARKFIDGMQGERYLNSTGEKIFYGLEAIERKGDVIIVEGIYDYLALVELGFRNVVATLSTNFKEQQAYTLRGRTVFVLFDADYAGFKGTQKAVEHLTAVGANPIKLDIAQFRSDVNDPHDAYLQSKAVAPSNDGFLPFQDWLFRHLSQYDQADNSYITEVFLPNKENLKCFKTPLPSFNATMGGGLKEGLHVFGGEPGVGKSALSLFLTGDMAASTARVLYCTYEISKRQCWSRVASRYERRAWEKIEMNPSELMTTTKTVLTEMSKRMRIVTGWGINEIERAADNYDIIVVDYIQRMPGRSSDVRTNCSENAQKLSNLARDKAKVIVCVSSLSRRGYGQEADMSALKESGDIEYVAQSITFLNRAGDSIIIAKVVKNTRGHLGKLWLDANLATCTFQETSPMDDQQPESEFERQVANV